MSLELLKQIASDEKLISVDLLGYTFQFDVTDVDIEAVQRMQDFVPKAAAGFNVGMYAELEKLFAGIIGAEHFEKAMAGKNKSIKNLAKLTIAVSGILTEVTAYYESSGKPTEQHNSK